MRVLVVDDNLRLLSLIAAHLTDAGLTVDTSSNALEFRDIAASTNHLLYLVDLGLPDDDGIKLVQEVRRSRRNTLILVITGRQQIRDRVCAFDSGADDCLLKPFHVAELLARVKALLRRPHVLAPQRLRTGELVLDCDTNEIFCGDRRVELRPSEQRLLGLLIRRSGHLVSKETIQATLDRLDSENSPNALEKLVSRLRRSLADCPAGINLKTVKGLGYVLEERLFESAL